MKSLSPYTNEWTATGRWVAFDSDHATIVSDNFSTELSAWSWIHKNFPEGANGVTSNIRPEFFDN